MIIPGLRLITLMSYGDLDYCFRISQKPNVIIVLLYIVLKKTSRNTLSQLHKEPELILLLQIMHCAHNLQISQLSASR